MLHTMLAYMLENTAYKSLRNVCIRVFDGMCVGKTLTVFSSIQIEFFKPKVTAKKWSVDLYTKMSL